MTIRFRRQHAFGLAAMRKLVKPWIDDLAARYALQTFVVKGRSADVIKFSRAGLDGEVTVGADHIEVSAQLGFLFAAFGQTIATEFEKNLDAFIADAKRAAASAEAGPVPNAAEEGAAAAPEPSADAPGPAPRRRPRKA